MTMTTPKRSAEATARSSIKWTIVQAGLWVGKANGEFAGMIEAHGDAGFSATTHRAKNLGRFPTVDDAKASFEE